MMLDIHGFDQTLSEIKQRYQHGGFEYSDPTESFRACVAAHFPRVGDFQHYGVYVVWQRGSGKTVYVGKGGTVCTEGKFKGQDVPGRLRNVRGGDKSADDWFRELLREYGPVAIEYILLPVEMSPGFVEAYLLQAYLNEHKCLPRENRSL